MTMGSEWIAAYFFLPFFNHAGYQRGVFFLIDMRGQKAADKNERRC